MRLEQGEILTREALQQAVADGGLLDRRHHLCSWLGQEHAWSPKRLRPDRPAGDGATVYEIFNSSTAVSVLVGHPTLAIVWNRTYGTVRLFRYFNVCI